VAKLDISWPQERQEACVKSKLDELFQQQRAQPPRWSLPFFLDLHNELCNSAPKACSQTVFSSHTESHGQSFPTGSPLQGAIRGPRGWLQRHGKTSRIFPGPPTKVQRGGLDFSDPRAGSGVGQEVHSLLEKGAIEHVPPPVCHGLGAGVSESPDEHEDTHLFQNTGRKTG